MQKQQHINNYMPWYWPLVIILLSAAAAKAQNVGIGTANPVDKLHVVGPARFIGNVGIGAAPDNTRKLYVAGGGLVNGLLEAQTLSVSSGASVGTNLFVQQDLFVSGDGILNGNFRVNGRIGVNGATNSSYGLIVNNANTYLQGDAIVEGNTRINGRIGINGATDGSYGLIVNNANSFLDGNLTVAGSTALQGPVTIQGKGSVRSNGSSALRIGFSNAVFHGQVGGKDSQTFNVSIPSIIDASDARPIISSVKSTGPSNDPENIPLFTWYVSAVNAANNTCTITVTNTTGLSKLLSANFDVVTIVRD